jgi:ATP-binding cassette subfamily C protein
MNRQVVRLLGQALRREPRHVAAIACWSAVEAAPSFAVGYTVARAIEDFARHRAGAGLAWLALLAAVWVVAGIGARQVVLAVASVVEPFRDRMLERAVGGALRRAGHARMPPDPAAVTRSNLQVELARDAFAGVISVLRSFVFTVVGVVLGMTTLMPLMLVLVVPPFAVGLALFLLSLPALARRQREFLMADEATVETVSGLLGGLRDIAACGAQETVAERTGERITGQARAAVGLARATALRSLALAIGGWAPVGCILAGSPWLIRHGANAGIVIGALTYVTQSLTPSLSALMEGLGTSGVRLMAAMERIVETSDAAESMPVTGGVPAGLGVELREVVFAYGPGAAPVVDGLDLEIPEGDHIAVVGPSGIGKSTLAGLVAGMLEPLRGTVTVGGLPAAALDRRHRVLIPQESYVFRGTLRENLTYLERAPHAEVVRAVAALGMGDLVERLGGYEAVLEPGELSAGERQLVALARAYVSPARLMLLDEATCHLDPVAEARAERAFRERGGTLVVIAHRLSSAVRARRVLLMDGTRVLLGTHAELLEASPLYTELMGHWTVDEEREFAP